MPRPRLSLALAAALLVTVPFWGRSFPPITDLGQHVAQVRLLLDTLGVEGSPHVVQWWTPYGLCYLVIAAAWALVGAKSAGVVGAAMIVAGWVLAVHALAWRRGRAAGSALIASIFVFNHALGWGFLSFLTGFAVFVLFWIVAERTERSNADGRDLALLAAVSALLYLAHAQWFAFGAAWLALEGFVARLAWRRHALRLASLAPVLAVAAWWYPSLGRRGFSTPTLWLTGPAERLWPSEIVDAALGSVRGPVEGLLVGVLLLWAACGWAQSWWDARRVGKVALEPRLRPDGRLLRAAGVFFALALFLPERFQNSIYFAQRWMPLAAVALALGAPPPRLRAKVPVFLAITLLVVFVLFTWMVWTAFETVELRGLEASLEQVPEGARLLGLDFVRSSALVKGQPFFQMPAYAQAWQGATLSFSFAEFAPSLVVFRDLESRPRGRSFEWTPRAVTAADVLTYDRVLVNGDAALHVDFARRFPVVPLEATAAPWRLYRVERIEGDASTSAGITPSDGP